MPRPVTASRPITRNRVCTQTRDASQSCSGSLAVIYAGDVLVPRRRVRPFVILFTGRTGSSYLVSALEVHPNIGVMGEHLVPLRSSGPRAQLEWTYRYLRGPLVGRHKAVGFKTKLRDVLDAEAFGHVLRQLDARVVLLDRRNHVKQAVGRLTARRLHDATGRWNRRAGDEDLGPIVIDPDEFKERLRDVINEKAKTSAYVAGLNLTTLQICYEDLLCRPDATFARVLNFLGVRSALMRGTTRKNTNDDLRKVILNIDELRELYVDTVYKQMFDEILVS